MQVSVKADIKQARRWLRGLSTEVVIPAASSAINKTERQARTQTVRRTAEAVGARTQKVIRSRITLVRRSTWRRLEAQFLVAGTGLRANDLKGSPQQAGNGVNVGRHFLPGAFVAKMTSGHKSAFVRKPSASGSRGTDSKGRPRRHRLPIRHRHVPIKRLVELILARLERAWVPKKFRENFERELRWRLLKLQAKRR